MIKGNWMKCSKCEDRRVGFVLVRESGNIYLCAGCYEQETGEPLHPVTPCLACGEPIAKPHLKYCCRACMYAKGGHIPYRGTQNQFAPVCES